MQFYWKCKDCDETNKYPDVKFCEVCGSPITDDAEKQVILEIEKEKEKQAKILAEKEQKRLEQLKAQQELETKRQQAVIDAIAATEERKQVFAKMEEKKKRELFYARTSKFFKLFYNIASYSLCAFLLVGIILTTVLFVNKRNKIDFYNAFNGISQTIEESLSTHMVTIQSAEKSEYETESTSTTDSEIGTYKVIKIPKFFYKIYEVFDYKTDEILDYKKVEILSNKTDEIFDYKKVEIFDYKTDEVVENIKEPISFLKSNFHPFDNIKKLIDDISNLIS